MDLVKNGGKLVNSQRSVIKQNDSDLNKKIASPFIPENGRSP
jgi:hypothetical protein